MTREESFAKAFEEKKRKKAQREALTEAKIEEFAAKNPRYNELKNKIGAAGARLAMTAFSGNREALEELRLEIEGLTREMELLLENAGVGKSAFECERCEDTGYIGGKICDCIKSEAKKIMINSLSKALPLENSRFENFDLKYYQKSDDSLADAKKRMTAILKLCKEYVLNFSAETSESLLFMGNTGLGKTHLSLAMVYELLERGFNVIYGSAYNLFSVMESEHFERHTNENYEAAIGCELLVIDDLGGEFVSPYIQSLLYNIINTRLLSGKPTIINTNLSMGEIAERYTPRVSSRLLSYTAKKFIGNDIRQIKAIEKK